MSLFSKSDPQAERKQMMREQENRATHRQMQQSMFNDSGQVRREYLEELTEAGIPDETAKHLQELLSEDFVLGNLKDEEVQETRWLGREAQKEVEWMHPHEDSVAQGEYRKFLYDDPRDGLSALSDRQQVKIGEFMLDFFARVSRGRGGWQQEEMGKHYTVSEMKDDGKSSGGIGGLFS